jgi:hypothetical protein
MEGSLLRSVSTSRECSIPEASVEASTLKVVTLEVLTEATQEEDIQEEDTQEEAILEVVTQDHTLEAAILVVDSQVSSLAVNSQEATIPEVDAQVEDIPVVAMAQSTFNQVSWTDQLHR